MEGTLGTGFVSIEEEMENITMDCTGEMEAKTTQALKVGN